MVAYLDYAWVGELADCLDLHLAALRVDDWVEPKVVTMEYEMVELMATYRADELVERMVFY
jgi:hypothetical protein